MAADLHKFLFKSKFMRKIEYFIVFTILVLCLLIVLSEAKDCSDLCNNGRCVDGRCVCYPGWSGDNCQYCHGRVRFWNSSGVISDGPGNYSEDNQCTWLIDPEKSNSSIHLYLSHFATECSWDHLYIYDGGSIYDPLLAVFSGMVVNDGYKVSNSRELVAHSGKALVHFYSDAAYNLTGFSIRYRVDGCPSSSPDTDCSGKGVCIEGKCTCNGGWTGPSCSIHICPNNCSGNGDCLMEQHRCVCHAGFTGADCDQRIDDGWWEHVAWSRISNNIAENLNEMASEEVLERASHAVVVIDGVAWVIGGYSFTDIPFLVLYNISDNAVQIINSPSKNTPSARYGHTAVAHNNSIYMFGGTLQNGEQSSELWRFRPSSLIWDLVTDIHHEPMLGPSSRRRRNRRSDRKVHRLQALHESPKKALGVGTKTGNHRCLNSANELCGPFATVGHSAVVVRDRFMLVLLGYSSVYGSVNLVQEFYFESNIWKIVETYGAVIDGTYGHTSVWDPQTLLVFVHGGLRTAYSNSVVSDLVTYDPFKHKWVMMEPAPIPRFLHSSILTSGLMLVYGGNTHNDTSYSNGARCYSADILAYDIRCRTWHTLPPIPNLGVENSRYGHSAVMWRDTVVILGGFNGLMLGSVLRFHLGRCEHLENSTDCQTRYPGRKCAWNVLLDRCEETPAGEGQYEYCAKKEPIAQFLRSSYCSKETSCHSCIHNIHDCQWCDSKCSHKCNNYLYDFHKKKIERRDNCPNRRSEWCKSMKTCKMCLASGPLCSWSNRECVFLLNSTIATTPSTMGKIAKKTEKRDELVRQPLALRQSAANPDNATTTTAVMENPLSCAPTCAQRESCFNCTQGPCMWCFNQQRCVSNDSYLISFPYGQCREWTTESRKCVSSDNGLSKCLSHQTCETCQGDVSCGWCADTSGTGTGVCLEGGQKGPVNPITRESKSRRCPRKRWFFTGCPSCSCNGHSRCVNGSMCLHPCANNTRGLHCEKCTETYYGNPINGGICKPCQCNGHEETCEHDTGKCHCNTKGVTGDRCDRCDTQNNYYGVPKQGGSCFYDLQIDYQFTFNLSKQEDMHIRQINFYNIPSKPEVDTDFDIQCSKDSRIMISVKIAGEPEVWIMQNFTGKSIRRRFSAAEYVFGSLDNNTTFHVYVFNFVPPIEIVISFSQHPKLDLVQFFSIFSLCFLVLLLIAFILWKIKQKYDVHTRRQRLVEELQAMASRPFQTTMLELRRIGDGAELPKTPAVVVPVVDSAPERRKPPDKKSKSTRGAMRSFINGNGKNSSCNGVKNAHAPKSTPISEDIQKLLSIASPVALEPCVGDKAAVMSLIIQLPNGGSRFTPPGHPGGLAVASSLVMLDCERKASMEVLTTTREIIKDVKKNRGKKSYDNNHATSL